MLSLLSVTPGPTMGTYADMPLLPPMEAAVAWQPMTPQPTGGAQGSLLPSPSGRLVPSPPRHPAPATGLLSPEKAIGGPPARDATDEVAPDAEEPSHSAEEYPSL